MNKRLNFNYQPVDEAQESLSASPIILLHGLLGSLGNWRAIQKRLSLAGYASYALDLRNHGDSFHDDVHDYPAMAQDVMGFMEKLADEYPDKAAPIMLGHSMGGKVAIYFAFHHLKMLSGLVIVDIAPVNYSHGHDAVFKAMQDIDLTQNFSRKQVRESLNLALEDMNMAAFLAQNYKEAMGEGTHATWRINLDILAKANQPLTQFPLATIGHEKYSQPCLIIAGGKSHYVAPQFQNSFSDFFDQYHLEILKKSGHWPHIDNSDLFMSTLINFLKKL